MNKYLKRLINRVGLIVGVVLVTYSFTTEVYQPIHAFIGGALTGLFFTVLFVEE